MIPIEALAMQSQEQHRRYHELYGTSPVRGDGLREIAAYSREVGRRERDLRQQIINLHFSTEVTG